MNVFFEPAIELDTIKFVNKKTPQIFEEFLCPEQESNLHTLWAADFESAASTNSAIWAFLNGVVILHHPSNLSKIRCKYFFL